MAMARWNSKSRGFGRPASFSQHEQHRRCPGSRAPGWLVGRVTYHNPDNGYCVLRVKVRGHRDLVTVLGHAASISAGEFVQASGKWEVHREHGQQFRAAVLKSARRHPLRVWRSTWAQG